MSKIAKIEKFQDKLELYYCILELLEIFEGFPSIVSAGLILHTFSKAFKMLLWTF